MIITKNFKISTTQKRIKMDQKNRRITMMRKNGHHIEMIVQEAEVCLVHLQERNSEETAGHQREKKKMKKNMKKEKEKMNMKKEKKMMILKFH